MPTGSLILTGRRKGLISSLKSYKSKLIREIVCKKENTSNDLCILIG